jgi:hypothetical protein
MAKKRTKERERDGDRERETRHLSLDPLLFVTLSSKDLRLRPRRRIDILTVVASGEIVDSEVRAREEKGED